MLDGECSAEEREHLDAHIGVCPECRANAESLQKASALFSNAVLELDIKEPERPKPELSLGRKYARKQPQFSEEYHGYATFSELLEDAEKHRLIKLREDERSGTYVIEELRER